MVLNKLKIYAVRMVMIMVYQLDILRYVIVVFILNIDKIFDIHTLHCCRNGILTWYQWSCNNIHRFGNIYNKLNPEQDQQQQYISMSEIFNNHRSMCKDDYFDFFCCDESENNRDDNITVCD